VEAQTIMPAKKTKGRPPIKIDPIEVRKLASYGCNLNEIADFFGVSTDTIRRRFREDVSKGKVDVKIRLRKAQLKAAIEDRNPTMLVWLGKNMLNQSDHGAIEEDELIESIDFGIDDGES
jgi:AraC-like DNA-binding protein